MSKPPISIGVLALQGAFAEHLNVLEQLNINAIAVRLPEHLKQVQGLIIPGGESTVIGRLLHEWGLWQVIRDRVENNTLGIWGSCAGAILLAKQVPNLDIEGLRLMDMSVTRNAFGRQKDSFIAPLQTNFFDKNPFLGVFIRAPIITRLGKTAKPLAWLGDGSIVAAQQDQLLASAFHPELTQDFRFHRYFISMLKYLK